MSELREIHTLRCTYTFTCIPWYIIMNTDVSISFLPTPVVDCGHPGSPPNGLLSGEKFTFGSTVRYSCAGGRQLKGESSRTCQLNGVWSAPMPFCSGNREVVTPTHRGGPPVVAEARGEGAGDGGGRGVGWEVGAGG